VPFAKYGFTTTPPARSRRTHSASLRDPTAAERTISASIPRVWIRPAVSPSVTVLRLVRAKNVNADTQQFGSPGR